MEPTVAASLRVHMGQRPTHRNESQHVTAAKAGVHVGEELDSRFRGNDVTFDRAVMGQRPTHRQDVTPAKAGVHVREEVDSRFHGNDVAFDGAVMGQRPTHRNESQHVTAAKAGVHVREEVDSRSPAFAEDKLRGNDVTFDGAQRGISLGVTWKGEEGGIPVPRLRDRNDSPAWVKPSKSFLSIRFLVFLLAGAVTCLNLFQAGAMAKPEFQSLPAGYALYLRLETAISTTGSHLHDEVKARFIREVDSGNRVLIPLGAEVQGRIEKLIPSSSPTDRARLLTRFDRLMVPGQPVVSFAGHISEVENAREKVLQDGTIQGVLASELPVSYLEDEMGKLAGQDSELSKYEQKAFGKSDTAISYGAGTDLTLVLDKPLSLAEMLPSGYFRQLPRGVPGAVARMLQSAPQRATGKDGKPGDPLNLVVIGNISEIREVFKQAGWGEAERKTGKAVWDTVRAVAGEQGFGRAPVSDLYLFGHREDLAFEKTLNTFLKRHHLRLWRTAATTPGGREIWLGAATHDTGLDVHPGVVSHEIDPDLDAERTKVGADLRVTGRVAAEQLVTRPNPLSQGLTATGGAWKTDGRLLVIDLAGQ